MATGTHWREVEPCLVNYELAMPDMLLFHVPKDDWQGNTILITENEINEKETN